MSQASVESTSKNGQACLMIHWPANESVASENIGEKIRQAIDQQEDGVRVDLRAVSGSPPSLLQILGETQAYADKRHKVVKLTGVRKKLFNALHQQFRIETLPGSTAQPTDDKSMEAEPGASDGGPRQYFVPPSDNAGDRARDALRICNGNGSTGYRATISGACGKATPGDHHTVDLPQNQSQAGKSGGQPKKLARYAKLFGWIALGAIVAGTIEWQLVYKAEVPTVIVPRKQYEENETLGGSDKGDFKNRLSELERELAELQDENRQLRSSAASE